MQNKILSNRAAYKIRNRYKESVPVLYKKPDQPDVIEKITQGVTCTLVTILRSIGVSIKL